MHGWVSETDDKTRRVNGGLTNHHGFLFFDIVRDSLGQHDLKNGNIGKN